MSPFTFRQHGLRFPKQEVARSPAEAVSIAASYGPRPVALKIVSPDVPHKSDVGGVELGLVGGATVAEAFERIVAAVRRRVPTARLDGVLVQEMVPPGVDLVVGLTRDPDFGPVLMVGLGGVFTDLVRDVAFGTLPASREDARRMVESLRFRPLLSGYRAGPRVDLEMLVDLLTTVSDVGTSLAERLGSIDLNPVVFWDGDYRVLDEKVLLNDGARPVVAEPPDTSHLAGFFEARSVALIGASPVRGKIGYFVMDSLARHDFRGRVFPVNPQREEILGLRAWPSLSAVPEPVDLTVVTTPLEAVPALVAESALKGCHNMVVISGGGKELGGRRAALEEAIRGTAREKAVRVVGCNCIGVFDAQSRLDTFFQAHDRMVRPAAGKVAMVTQSGTVGAMFLEGLEHVGVSKFVSFGNRIDVDESDLLAYLAEDPATTVIAVYCEGFRSGLKFVRCASQVTKTKPVVMFKAARSPQAAEAAVSHTGFYGGSYEVARGALIQAGVIVVDSVEELLAASKALACLPAARGNRVAMVSNGAGTTIQAVDLLPSYGLALAELSSVTVSRLRRSYPDYYQVGPVVDVTGSATVKDYSLAIRALGEDPTVDIVMPWFVLQDTPLEDTITDALVELTKSTGKPVVAAAAGGPYTLSVRQRLERAGVPLLASVREWVAAAMSLSWACREPEEGGGRRVGGEAQALAGKRLRCCVNPEVSGRRPEGRER